jgi:DNA-binding IscR family transcriptional regulator
MPPHFKSRWSITFYPKTARPQAASGQRLARGAVRESGFVKSTSGPGGGWALACDLKDLTVRDVYHAIGHAAPFVIGLADDNRTCPVEAAVNRHISEALGSAENKLLESLGERRLSEIAYDVTSSKPRKMNK